MMSVGAVMNGGCAKSNMSSSGNAFASRAVSAGHFEVPFVAATTGPANLVAAAHFRDTRHLYEYLTGELASLPGVRAVETAPIIRTLKRTGSVR